MTKKRSFDILIGLTFLGLLGLYLYDHHYVVPAKRKVIISRPEIIKANDILRRKTTIPESILNTTATSSACTLFLKNSAELSMNDFANEFIDHNVDRIVKTCAGAFPTLLQQRIDKALLVCKSSIRDNITKECYAALLETKTSSVAAIIKEDANPKELDSSILLHLIADKFATGDFLEHPERSLEIIDALIEKEPNYLGGYKVKLLLLSMSTLNKEEHYKDMFQDTLDEALGLKANDPEIKEIALAQRGDLFKQSLVETPAEKKHRKEFVEYLDQESAKYPKEWIYDYYKANALYDGGRGDYYGTVAAIEGLLKRAPNDGRLKQTLDNLKNGEEDKRKHPFVLVVGFSLDDL